MTKLQNLFNDFNDYKAFQEHYYNYNKPHIISENFADALLGISWDGIADQIEEQVKSDNIGKQIHIIGTWYTDGKWIKTSTFVGILKVNLKF